MPRRISLVALLLILLGMSHSARAVASGPANGGFADAGLIGEYFANTNFDGTPRFVRRDPRIDFDWRQVSPAGSRQSRYRTFPAGAFSIRWTGRILPRVAGLYYFATVSDDDMRVRIRPQGAPDWNNAIESRPLPDQPTRRLEGVYQFDRASVPYDIQIEYRHRGAIGGELRPDAVARLLWSTPGPAAWETVDSASGFVLDVDGEAFADVVKGRTADAPWRRLTDGHAPARVDAEGCPTGDAAFTLWDGGAARAGVYGIHFSGKADLALSPADGGQIASVYYDAAKNETTAMLAVPPPPPAHPYGPLSLQFRKTQRGPLAPVDSGIARLRILRPLLPGSETPTPADEVFVESYEQRAERFAVVRFARPLRNADLDDDITLANETGRDLCLTLPADIGEGEITSLMRRVRYGAGQDTPYERPTPNPLHPPLEPNLRLYVTCAEGESSPAATAELSFDGRSASEVLQLREHARQMRRISGLLRTAFGAEAIGDRVRVLLTWPDSAVEGRPAAAWELEYLRRPNDSGVSHPLADDFWGGGSLTAPQPPAAEDAEVAGPLILGGFQGFVTGNGRLTQKFTIPAQQTSEVYALRFNAVQRRRPDRLESDHESFDVQIDGKSIADLPVAEALYRPGPTPSSSETLTFTAEAGSTHKVTFVGHAPALPKGVTGPAQDSAQIDNVSLLSVDALFDHPAPGKAAQIESHRRSAPLARQYGLHPVFSETTWPAGGQTPLRIAAAAHDPRLLLSAQTDLDADAEAAGGGPLPALVDLGRQSSAADSWDGDGEELPRAIDTANARLPAESKTALLLNPAALSADAPYVDLTLGKAGQVPEPNAPESGAVSAEKPLIWQIRLAEPEKLKFIIAADDSAGGGLQITIDGRTPSEKEAETYSMGTHVICVSTSATEPVEGVRGVRVVFVGVVQQAPLPPTSGGF